MSPEYAYLNDFIWGAGITLSLILCPLLPGVIARVKAFFAGRKGPRLLQLYFDLAKLLRKESVYSSTSAGLVRLMPLCVLASLLCALLFLVLAFCLVNPTWQPSPIFPEVWMLAAFGIWGMGLVSWLVLRLLRGLEEGTMEKVSAVLRVLLVGCAALLVFAAALHGSRAVAAAVDGPAPEQIAMGQLITGGPFDRVMSAGSLWLTAVLALAELVPNLLAAWVLLLAADLTDALALGPFSGESAARCAATARRCRLAIQLTLALALGGNLVKLALVGVIPQVQFSLDLPLLPLTLAAALYLLCRCIQRGKELQEDNDSII